MSSPPVPINRGSVGLSGAFSTIFYVEVTDAQMDTSGGGGNADEGEYIEVVNWPMEKASELLTMTESGAISVSTPTVLSILWFQLHIQPTL